MTYDSPINNAVELIFCRGPLPQLLLYSADLATAVSRLALNQAVSCGSGISKFNRGIFVRTMGTPERFNTFRFSATPGHTITGRRRNPRTLNFNNQKAP